MTHAPHDSPAFVARLRAGDRAAFEALFRQTHAGLVRYARSLDAAGADDAVQDAFLKVWRRRDTLDPERSVTALLYTSVRNTLFNRTRDRARQQDLRDTMPALDPPVTPADELDATLLGEHLRTWLGEMPDRQREAFRLSRFDGLSYAEIAGVMACSTKTVENHVGRALRFLRDRIQQVAPEALQL